MKFYAISTVNAASFGWRIVATGDSRREAAEAAEAELVALGADIYAETMRRNMMVVSAPTARRQYGVGEYEYLDDTEARAPEGAYRVVEIITRDAVGPPVGLTALAESSWRSWAFAPALPPSGDDAHESGVSAHGLGPTVAPGAYIAPIPCLPAPCRWAPLPNATPDPFAALLAGDDAGVALGLSPGDAPERAEWDVARPVPFEPLQRSLQRYSAGYYSLLSRPSPGVQVRWTRRFRNRGGAFAVLTRITLGEPLYELLSAPVRREPDIRRAHAELVVQIRDASSGSGRRTWEVVDPRRCRLTVRSRRTGEVTRWRLRDCDAQELLERVALPALAAQALDALVAAAT